MNRDIKNLFIKFGLTAIESEQLYDLLYKMSASEDNIVNYLNELEKGIPFEGGMYIDEALTGLLITFSHYKNDN